MALCILIVQYVLHLPLSYLTKQWFWTESSAVKNIDQLIVFIPKKASLVSQNNITPHVSERDLIFTLWPTTKTFSKNSPCRKVSCNWLRWAGRPRYLIVDTSSDWDKRHLLANRQDFVDGINNLEKAGAVSVYMRIGNATLYKINKNPEDFK